MYFIIHLTYGKVLVSVLRKLRARDGSSFGGLSFPHTQNVIVFLSAYCTCHRLLYNEVRKGTLGGRGKAIQITLGPLGRVKSHFRKVFKKGLSLFYI